MQLKPEQLRGHLAGGRLMPIYVVTGDEPLQIKETGDAIRNATRDQGFSVRELFEVNAAFDWAALSASADALSLFGDQRLFDLRIPNGKPGKEGGKALAAYAANPPPDTLLLVTLPKLEKAQRGTKWFTALEKAGVVITLWPMEARAYAGWLQRRAAAAGMVPDRDALAFLAGQTEGNLLAAAQEIEKLVLLHGAGPVSLAQMAASVAGSARYNVFELVDSALRGTARQSLRVFQGLRGEGTPAPVVLWALVRELRLLEALATAAESGGSPQAVFAAHRIWESRKALLAQGARRQRAAGWRSLIRLCALADRAIKGQDKADPWSLLEDIVLGMAAGRAAPAALAG